MNNAFSVHYDNVRDIAMAGVRGEGYPGLLNGSLLYYQGSREESDMS